MFTATWIQTATYLFAVCPFSIAFLVFMNSSVPFVITDLIKLPDGEGDAAGTLGFADELLALVACPVWGIASDRIGVRNVRSMFLPHLWCSGNLHEFRSVAQGMSSSHCRWCSLSRREMSTRSFYLDDSCFA